MKLLIIRRPGWAVQSMAVLESLVPEVKACFSDALPASVPEGTTTMRWGWTGRTLPSSLLRSPVINKASAIRRTSNKGEFAFELSELRLGPKSYRSEREWFSDADDGDMWSPWLSRPNHHMRGQGIEEVNRDGARRSLTFYDDRYVRQYIDKVAEFRAYVLCGKVLQIEQKTVADPSAIAWGNEGANFTNISFSAWPLEVAEKAIKAVELAGLHYGAVDVIVGDCGGTYVLEVNTAPDLYGRRGGQPSYVQRVMARGLKWHIENGWGFLSCPSFTRWQDMLHPSAGEYR